MNTEEIKDALDVLAEENISDAENNENADELERLRGRLEGLEKEIAEREKKLYVMSLLAQKKLPGELAELIIHEDPDEVTRRADMIEAVIAASVRDEVSRRMPRSAPTAGNMKKLSRADILNMSLAELSDYYV